MRNSIVGAALCSLALLVASEATGGYLSTRSRPSAENEPEDRACYPHRRVAFDQNGTVFFTMATEPTFDEELALRAALKAWNDVPGSSVRLEYGGVGDNADFLGFADPFGDCPSECQELSSNAINAIELHAADGECPLTDASETILANPGFRGAWEMHDFCGEAHWSLGGARIRVASGITGGALARVLAHEIGMALGFATTDLPGNVLNPDIDLTSTPPPYSVTLGPWDLEALTATYPAWQINAPADVCGESTGNLATILDAHPSTTYTWTAHDGAAITSGQGTSTVTFSVPPFEGYIICIIGPCPQQTVRLTVTADAGCSGPGTSPTFPVPGSVTIPVVAGDYEISPIAANFDSSGGSGSFEVVATRSCGGWTASAPFEGFVTITSGFSGSGNGTVHYSVAGNPWTWARSSTLTVAGKTVEITQSGSGKGAISLTAAAVPSQVALSWTPISGATSYTVFRGPSASALTAIASVSGLTMTDPNVTDGFGYLYRVSAWDGDEYVAHSNVDVAVPFSFTDATLSAGTTPIRATHLLELREVLAAARFALGWPAPVFASSIAPGQPVLRAHLSDLRAQVNLVRGGVGLGGYPFVDPVLTPGVTPPRTSHILNLRDALR